MINANEYRVIVNNEKQVKFDKMVKIQEKFIKENMADGKRSVLWIFSDKEYYNTNFERQWFTEFYNSAKSIFARQGFVIKGITINW
jgi:aromatic ring-opening dioxygenase LigB subunit